MGVLKRAKGTYDVLLEVAGQEVAITMRALPLGRRMDLLAGIQDLDLTNAKCFDRLCEFIAEVVVEFKEEAGTVPEVLKDLDDPDDFREIVKQVCRNMTLSEAERKNSYSSPGLPTAGSAGSAGKPATAVGEPASTTPSQTEA